MQLFTQTISKLGFKSGSIRLIFVRVNLSLGEAVDVFCWPKVMRLRNWTSN